MKRLFTKQVSCYDTIDIYGTIDQNLKEAEEPKLPWSSGM
jgi:hypothetical protein